MWFIVTLLWLPWAGLAVWLARQLSLGRNPNEEADALEQPREHERERHAHGGLTERLGVGNEPGGKRGGDHERFTGKGNGPRTAVSP